MPDVDGTSPLRLASLPRNTDRPFSVVPAPGWLADLARALDLSALRKLRFQGRLSPEGKRDWRLEATLGATVVQPCVVTGAPVTTRIDVPVLRRFSSSYVAPKEGEAEMPEDDTLDPLPEMLSLLDVLEEALALEVPAYPRAEGVAPAEATAAPPGAAPLPEQDVAKPFAGLAGLRDRLARPDPGENGEDPDTK